MESVVLNGDPMKFEKVVLNVCDGYNNTTGKRFYVVYLNVCNPIRFFTNYTKMLILASEALLRENKQYSDKMLPSVGMEPGPLITSDT